MNQLCASLHVEAWALPPYRKEKKTCTMDVRFAQLGKGMPLYFTLLLHLGKGMPQFFYTYVSVPGLSCDQSSFKIRASIFATRTWTLYTYFPYRERAVPCTPSLSSLSFPPHERRWTPPWEGAKPLPCRPSSLTAWSTSPSTDASTPPTSL
jgi:hypothetical protein